MCLSVSCFSSCLSLIVQEKEAAKKLKAQTKAKGKGRGRGRGQGRGRQKGRGKGRSRHAQAPAVQLPQVQESDSEVEKGDAVDEEMQVPAAGEVTAVDEEMQLPDVALPTGVLPPATPVSTTSTSVVPAMDAEQQLSAEPLLATENPVAEDLLAAGPSNVPSTTEGTEPDPSTSVSPPHAAAPVVPEEPVAPVVPEEPAAPVVPVEPAAPVVPAEPAAPVVPEEPAAPVVPAEPAGPVVPRFVSAKEHQTPAIMQRLAPPFCTFALDFKAHGFSFKYRKAPSPNVWTEHFKYPMSMSKTFANMPWQDALKEVHAGAWHRWSLAKDQSGWELLPADAQTPGCIAADVLAEMAGVIDSLPPVVTYPRAASA